MSFFFRSNKVRSPQDLVKGCKEAIQRLDTTEKRKASDDVSRSMLSIKTVLIGDADTEPLADQVALLAQEAYSADLLRLLAINMWRFDFEARKDATNIFTALVRRQIGSKYPTVEHLRVRPDVLFSLLHGYESAEVAINCGNVLREAFQHETLARVVLFSDRFWKLFDYVSSGTFDIASDAFSTFKNLLTHHIHMVSEFLSSRYDKFFSKYNLLLSSDSYVTKRQSVKLLSEILLNRPHFTIMTRYIDSADNLKLIMNLLLQQSVNIKYEAFHVFKVRAS